MGVKHLGGWWTVPLLAVFSVGAADRNVPLVEAVKSGDTESARTLLQKDIDVNAPTDDGTTALHWAAHRADLAAADLLIRAGANAQAANRYGVTPLWLACTNGDAAMIETL